MEAADFSLETDLLKNECIFALAFVNDINKNLKIWRFCVFNLLNFADLIEEQRRHVLEVD